MWLKICTVNELFFYFNLAYLFQFNLKQIIECEFIQEVYIIKKKKNKDKSTEIYPPLLNKTTLYIHYAYV